MAAQNMDPAHWIALMAALIAIFTVLITILLWQMTSIKQTMMEQGKTLFSKMDALVEKKVSIDQCSEFRRLCYQHCPYRVDGRDRNGT